MTAQELLDAINNGLDDPNDIFMLHEAYDKLPPQEKELLREDRHSEAFAMLYITAVEMKKDGTWDAYVEQRKKKIKKTAEEIKRELLENYPAQKVRNKYV